MHIGAKRLEVVQSRLVADVAGADEMLRRCKDASSVDAGAARGAPHHATASRADLHLDFPRDQKTLELLRDVGRAVWNMKVADHEDEHLCQERSGVSGKGPGEPGRGGSTMGPQRRIWSEGPENFGLRLKARSAIQGP